MIRRTKLPLGWINRDGRMIIASRGLCAFAQSSVAIIMALYLKKLGFSLVQIGAFLSVGVAGSACLAFIVSLISEKVGRRRLLVAFALLSGAAGLTMVFINEFLPIIFIAFLGSITGSAGTPAQPLEQASLADTAPAAKRTDLFATYRIISTAGNALGALAAGLPTLLQNTIGLNEIPAYKAMFIGFAFFLWAAALLYSLLSPSIEVSHAEQRWINPLQLPSRKLIFSLVGLFSLDNFAGSLFMQSLVAYWFNTRFGLALGSLALVFFLSDILSAISLWAAAKLGNLIGLINTMVFTHIP
ncbi:MAG: MFS transporter, partial [Chloroflexi bacterium]|nr:MFS transporter [Chloroflexota bacterium]